MKKILGFLGALTIAGSSMPVVFANSPYQSNNVLENYKTKIIQPTGQKLFLTVAGDWMTKRTRFSMLSLNLGHMLPRQVKGISSTYHDNYIEHKVVSYDYHKIDKTDIGTHFKDETFCSEVGLKPPFTLEFARKNAVVNFYSKATWGLASHEATATIKFWCYTNEAKELILLVYVTLEVGAAWSTVEGVASIKLGSAFTIYYTD